MLAPTELLSVSLHGIREAALCCGDTGDSAVIWRGQASDEHNAELRRQLASGPTPRDHGPGRMSRENSWSRSSSLPRVKPPGQVLFTLHEKSWTSCECMLLPPLPPPPAGVASKRVQQADQWQGAAWPCCQLL